MINPNTKLMREIQTHMSDEACNIHHGLSAIEEVGELENGTFQEFNVGKFKFGCALQKLTDDLKVTFYFYECLNEEEEWYWGSKDYQFRLNAGSNTTDYNHTLAVMRLRNIHKELPVKVIMFKCLDTLFKFKRDFKYIVTMLRTRPYEDMVNQEIKKKYERLLR